MRRETRLMVLVFAVVAFLLALSLPSGSPQSESRSPAPNLQPLDSLAVATPAAPETTLPAGPPTAPATTVTVAAPTTLPPTPVNQDDSDWTLVFRDEFDGGELAGQRWVSCYWWDDSGCTNKGNNELEWYQPGNVVVRDGIARLVARREPIRASDGETYPYTSGMITTGRDRSDLDVPPRFVFTYGFVEVRARIPEGKGLWPALWLLAADHNSRPEIDIVEFLGDTTDIARFHVHYLDRDGERRDPGFDFVSSDFAGAWHVFAVDWTPDRITWFVDGIARWEVTDPAAISQESMYLIANLAVGGDWPGAPDDDTIFPAAFELDYVRIWQSGSSG